MTDVIASSGEVRQRVPVVVTQVPAEIQLLEPDTFRALEVEALVTFQARDSSGSEIADLTGDWASADPEIVSIVASGLATSHANGQTEVSFVGGGIRQTAELVVLQLPVMLSTLPDSVSLTVGGVQRLEVRARDANGQPVADIATNWNSTNEGVATVTSSGVLRGIGEGHAWARASAGVLRDSTFVRVDRSVVLVPKLIIKPDTLRFQAYGQHIRPVAYLDDGAGNRSVVQPSWRTSNTQIVVPYGPGGPSFVASNAGSAWVIATYGALTDSALAIVKYVWDRMTLDRGFYPVDLDQTVSVRARLYNSLGGVGLPNAEWTLRDTTIASLSSSMGGQVSVTGKMAGETYLVSTYGEFTDSARIQVSSALFGDLVVKGTADIDRVQRMGVTHVRGNLTIANTELSTLDGLGSLQWVGGSLAIRGNMSLTSSDALKDVFRIAGGLIIEKNPSLRVPSFPKLLSTGGIVLGGNGSIETPALFPVLGSVDGGVTVSERADILRFPALRSTQGLGVKGPGPTRLELPILATAGPVSVLDAQTFTEFAAPSLVSATSFMINGNPALVRISAPALESEIRLQILGNPDLESVDLASVPRAHVTIADNPRLDHLDLTALELATRFSISNLALTSVVVPEVSSSSEILITKMGALTDLSIRATAVITTRIQDNPQLRTVVAPNATTLGAFRLERLPVLTGFEAPRITTLKGLSFVGNTTATFLSLPELTSISDHLTIAQTNELTSPSLPRLASVRRLYITQNARFTDLNTFSSVTSGLSLLRIVQNPILSDLTGLGNLGNALSADPIVTGEFRVTGNPALPAAVIATFMSALESKFSGTALSGTVTVNGNGG